MEITSVGFGALRLAGSVGPSDGPNLIEAIHSNQAQNLILERPEEPEPLALLDVLKEVRDWMREAAYYVRTMVWVGENDDLFEVLGEGLGRDSRIMPAKGWYGGGSDRADPRPSSDDAPRLPR
jgi:hypothetical protein